MPRFFPLLFLPLFGCAKLADLAKVIDVEELTPKVTFKKVKVDDVDWKGADATFLFKIDNPNPLDIEVASFSYDLDIAGNDLISGKNQEGVHLASQGSTQMQLPASLVFADLLSLADSQKGQDSVPFKLKGTFGFDTPLGEISIPYEEEGELPVLRPPTFELQAFRVGELSLTRQTATLELDLGVTNAQSENALTFSNFAYDIALSGTDVASSEVASLGKVGAGKTETVTLPIELNLLNLGTTIVSAITNKTQLKVALDAKVDVETPLGPLPLTVDETGKLELE